MARSVEKRKRDCSSKLFKSRREKLFEVFKEKERVYGRTRRTDDGDAEDDDHQKKRGG